MNRAGLTYAGPIFFLKMRSNTHTDYKDSTQRRISLALALRRAKSTRVAMLFLRTIPLWALILFNQMQPWPTTLVKKSLAELLSESDGIVVGTVSDLKSRYDKKKDLQTFVRLTDLKIVHGHYDGSSLTLQMQGGEINGNVLEVQDSPKFAVKDRVVLFLKDNGHELVPFVGWTQGVFRVFYDEQTGVDRIKDNSGNPVLAVAGDEIIKGQSLAPLKDGGAGKTNDGSRSEPISRSKEDSESQAITLKEFLHIITHRLKEKGLKGKNITNVNVNALTGSSVPEPGDAAPSPQ